MGTLAERKGLKAGIWKLYTVLSWIGAEIIGVMIAVVLVPFNIVVVMLLGISCALVGYFILKSNLSRRPDASMEHDIDQIGNNTP